MYPSLSASKNTKSNFSPAFASSSKLVLAGPETCKIYENVCLNTLIENTSQDNKYLANEDHILNIPFLTHHTGKRYNKVCSTFPMFDLMLL